MKMWVLAGTLAALAACADTRDRDVTRDDTRPVTTEVGYVELRASDLTFRDAKETRHAGTPLFAIYDEQGRRVHAASAWSGESASVTLPPGRYRVESAADLDDDDRDELWITVSPNSRVIVDLDEMEERTEAVVE